MGIVATRWTEVELRGTWSRTETSRGDVNHYRRRLRIMAKSRGFHFDAICHRKPLGQETFGGTFVFRVNLDVGANALKQAETLMRQLLFAGTCRPPKFKVDRGKSTTRFRVRPMSPTRVF